MDAGVTEIGVDEEHSLRAVSIARLTARFTAVNVLPSPWPGLVTPNTFQSFSRRRMHDLGPQNLKGIDKRALVVCSHHSPLTKHREWNIQRPRPGIHDGARQGLAAGSLCRLVAWYSETDPVGLYKAAAQSEIGP